VRSVCEKILLYLHLGACQVAHQRLLFYTIFKEESENIFRRIDRIGLKESKHTSLLLPSFICGSAKFFSIDPRFPEPKPIQKIIV